MNHNSSFDLHRIRDATFVTAIDFHWETASTNTRAIDLVVNASSESPLLVLAERQTAGRGRGTNRWWSTAGSLTFSVIVALDRLPAQRIPQISLTTGLAICHAIERLVPDADLGLKWPNDVHLNGLKLAGILIELPTSQPPQAVIGVGINVNNTARDADPEVSVLATSLRDACEVEFDLTDVVIACLQEVEAKLQQVTNGATELTDQWRAYDVLRGREVEIDTYNGLIVGRSIDIDDDGALILETKSGIRRCLGGVITRAM